MFQPLRVAQFFNRRAEQVLKLLLAAQKARHQEVEQAPDFAQMVFHRRARQAQALARAQLARHLRGLGAGVFDVLRFIQHHHVPAGLEPALAVALQQRIRRDDDVMVVQAVGQLMPVFAVQHQAAQVGAKARGLALPIAHQADRRHDQRRVFQAAGVFFNLDVDQGLQRFAQPHVVGQDAAQTVLT